MTLPFSHRRAGSALRCVLVLVAVVVSSLCAAGQSAAESVRTEPASAAADARPAAGPLVGKAAAEQGSGNVQEAAALHEAAGPSSSGDGRCGRQAASDTASVRDGSRPSAPLPTPEPEERRTPAAPAGPPGPASAGPGSAPPAPDLVQLSVLRI
ncbi:hypothetical protein ACFU5P_09050 [Streptomyces sp. NPDC057433]|uniref:hypothetical protein n=1 Tax=Streptomyces sp. NPDC057433 TaxID=3346132 RepID=UPI0036CA21A3